MPGLEAVQTLAPEPETTRSALPHALIVAGTVGCTSYMPRLDAANDDDDLAEQARLAAKRLLDAAGAAALLMLCLPAFLVLGALVKLDGGPIFYAHPRVGRGGRQFGCLKFRSMVTDADRRLADLLARDPAARAEWEASRKLKNDPRVTWVGRFLRATSLDELPQLINVLLGDMSLVGPRPVIAAELTAYYGAAAQHYMAVRPGITGPWQISGRSDTSYAQRVALDVAYVSNPSLLTDIRILLRTPAAVLARRGAY
jgi:lipopolysaccharide/colanic/teichoic acid biosynthesis glycosyltransferase